MHTHTYTRLYTHTQHTHTTHTHTHTCTGFKMVWGTFLVYLVWEVNTFKSASRGRWSRRRHRMCKCVCVNVKRLCKNSLGCRDLKTPSKWGHVTWRNLQSEVMWPDHAPIPRSCDLITPPPSHLSACAVVWRGVYQCRLPHLRDAAAIHAQSQPINTTTVAAFPPTWTSLPFLPLSLLLFFLILSLPPLLPQSISY